MDIAARAAQKAAMEPEVAVIGAGPAGLMAAEVLATAGVRVTVFDHMPSVARKFLIAGRGGLNLTHSEPLERFLTRYRPAEPRLLDAVRAFPPAAMVAWCEGLGVETFVGSSGRVFPVTMKASPLLRAWLARLSGLGVTVRTRESWVGFASAPSPALAGEGRGGGEPLRHAQTITLNFDTPTGPTTHTPNATILALGGASWPRLGSDATWPALLPEVRVSPFAPSNMGVRIAWSPHLARHAGAPLKRIAMSFGPLRVAGEAVLTATGLEGGATYALSAPIRDAIARVGFAEFRLDLRPDLELTEVRARLAARPRAETLSNRLRKALALPPVSVALVQEVLHGGAGDDPAELVKNLPLTANATAGLDRAISSAGGVAWSELDERFMLRRHPGLFACGEMLDWEAPTGGYLLQACFATGVAAARGVLGWLGVESAAAFGNMSNAPARGGEVG